METLITQNPNKLPDLVQNLNSSLVALQPNRSETTQIITYALLATAVVGIMVYQYVKECERSEDLKTELK